MTTDGLPSGWAWATINQIGTVITGTTPPTADPENYGGTIPFYKPTDLNAGYNVRGSIDTLSEAGANRARVLPARTVLVTCIGATIGKTGFAREPGATNQQINAVVTSPMVTMPEWCYWAITSSLCQSQIIGDASATTLPILNKKKFEQVRLPLAPLDEQRRIVEKVEELFTDLDAGVAALERVRTKLTRYRSAVLHAAVTGRLTASWRDQHGPPSEPGPQLLQRILAERRRQWEERTLAKYARDDRQPPKGWRDRYPPPAEPNTEGFPELPAGWCWATLDQLSDVVGGVAKNQKEAGRAGMRDVPYLRVANVQRGYLDLGEMKSISATVADIEELRLRAGDVLFTEGGDRDKLGRGWVWEGQIAECIHQNHVFRARPFLKEIRAELLSHAGNSYGQIWFQKNGKQTVNLASISLGVLRQFPVALPPGAEQAAIVEAVQEKLSQIDALEVEVGRGLARAGRLRQAILKAAFEGRLVPQDPADEPAATLLERLRHARTAAEPKGHGRKPTRTKTPRRRATDEP